MVIIELTVCYELSFQGAGQRKEAKYPGSRGFVDIDSFQPLQNKKTMLVLAKDEGRCSQT